MSCPKSCAAQRTTDRRLLFHGHPIFFCALWLIDRFLLLVERHTTLLEAQAREIDALKERVTKLEAREEVLIAEAKGAAAAAAAVVTAQHIAGLAREIGALDERTRHLGRLPPPQ